MARSLLSLETGILEQNAVKNATEITSFHDTLQYIVKVSSEKLKVRHTHTYIYSPIQLDQQPRLPVYRSTNHQ